MGYCDSKGLNMPILRVTWEAKTQLRDLLITTGFPESCFIPHEFSFSGPDSKLDLVVAMLVTGFWPNVCWHREKRKVGTRNACGDLWSLPLSAGVDHRSQNCTDPQGQREFLQRGDHLPLAFLCLLREGADKDGLLQGYVVF